MTKQLLLVAAALTFSTSAAAQVAEVRLGANIHDIDWTGLGNGGDKERSVAINGEIVFEEPEFLKWALSPQPYIGGAVNLGGETSYGGAGLLWRQSFAKKFYADFSFGLVVHDGTIEVDPSPLVQSVIDGEAVQVNFSPELSAQFVSELNDFRERQSNQIDFGSRVLFREQIAIGYRWNDTWSTEIFAEHLSNGKILTRNGPNEGLDTLGMRAAYRF